jgi:hypothetical protein
MLPFTPKPGFAVSRTLITAVKWGKQHQKQKIMKQQTFVFLFLALFSLPVFSQSSIQKDIQSMVALWDGKKSEIVKVDKETIVLFEVTKNEEVNLFHIVLSPDGKGDLKEGGHDQYLLKYTLDDGILHKLAKGELTSMTAMVKARSTEVAPMEADFNQALADEKTSQFFFDFSMYFFSQEWPPKFMYGKEYSRHTHGGMASVFVYNPGLRSGWFHLEEGMHVNKEDDLKTNPFPSLFIITNGEGKARLGDRVLDVKVGESYLIPAGMVHELWVEGDQVLEGIIMMFGEGA